jgi:Kef-type K+ transport system membrane component KefB
MSEILGPASIPLILGGLFLIGFVADLVGRFTFLPRVTLLLLSGLAIGPAGLSLLPESFVSDWFPALTSISLALIGFLLGHQLSIPALKKRGTGIIGISLCKVFGAWFTVGLVLLFAGANPVVALLLAGIAPATAPAATYDLVHEYQAKGEFSETLLAIVALDDIWGLLIFILMLTCAGVMNGNTDISAGVITSSKVIGGSVFLGIVLGVPMAYLTGRIRRGEPTLAEALGFVLLGAGIAGWLNLLPILSTMTMGITVASLAKHHERPFHAIEHVEWPFIILFFLLAGASLQIDILPMASGITVVYILSRCVGIYIGTRAGCRFVGAGPLLRKWLGLALFPQAGVAIGMALLAVQEFPEKAAVVLTVVVASTIILETVGPVFTRQAIRAVGANKP